MRLQLGDTEVHDLGSAVAQNPDVGRLHVAMDDALGMGIAETTSDLGQDLYFPGKRKLAVTGLDGGRESSPSRYSWTMYRRSPSNPKS